MVETLFADIVGLGKRIDILPYVRAVLAECPYPNDLTVNDLAKLAVRDAQGKYINVDAQDRVAGRMLNSLLRQIRARILFDHHDRAQLTDPELRKARPLIELSADITICAHAAAKSGRFLRDDELEPLPLPGCWGESCFCHYRLPSRRDLQRQGRLGVDGIPKPLPKVAATFSGIVVVNDEDDDDEEWA